MHACLCFIQQALKDQMKAEIKDLALFKCPVDLVLWVMVSEPGCTKQHQILACLWPFQHLAQDVHAHVTQGETVKKLQ